jgi:ABC-type spermidine/putrescine transport system permease subunit I
MADTALSASGAFAPAAPVQRGRINTLMAITVGLPVTYSLIFFIGPLIFLIAISFWKVENFRVTPGFSFDNYSDIAKHLFAQSNYAIAILQSFYVSVTTAIFAVVFCGLFVMALVFTLPQRFHRLALLLAVAPFWTSYILRAYAWQILLAKRGIINSLFSTLGIDLQLAVLNTQTATRIGLLHYMAPIITVILFITVKSIDRDLIEAARNLGATRWGVFRSVILPLSRVGIVLSLCFATIISFGDVLSGSILGGGAGQSLVGSVPLFSNMIMNDFSSSTNLPRTCVLALILVLILVTILLSGLKATEAAQRSIN